MSYLKFTPYLYLILGIYLIYDGIKKFSTTSEIAWLNIVFVVFVIFMFFFRRKYAKRFENAKKRS